MRMSLSALFFVGFIVQVAFSMPVVHDSEATNATFEEEVDLSGHPSPKTDKTCSDLKHLADTVTSSYAQLRQVNFTIVNFCTTVKDTVSMCDKLADINTGTKTTHTITEPLAHFPYIGPVLKLVNPVLKTVKVGTGPVKTACTLYSDRLRLRDFNAKCTTLMPYLNKVVARSTMILADIEIAQSLWCTCDNTRNDGKHPTFSDDVTAGCDCLDGTGRLCQDQGIFKCPKPERFICPPDPLRGSWSNAQHIAKNYGCATGTIENLSGKINAKVEALKAAVQETKNRIAQLFDWMNWLKKFDFLGPFKPIIDAFHAVLAPIKWLADKITWVLSQKITIKLPGCEEAQNEQQLSLLLQSKIGMTLEEATKPVTLEQQAEMARKWADKLVYRDIQTVHDEHMAARNHYKSITMVQENVASASSCKDMTPEELTKESAGKFTSCDKALCDDSPEACPMTCGLCSKKELAAEKGACKVPGPDSEAVVFNGMVGFFPVDGPGEAQDYCDPTGESINVHKGQFKYTCKDSVLTKDTDKVYCRTGTEEQETYSECTKCAGLAKSAKDATKELSDIQGQSGSSSTMFEQNSASASSQAGAGARWGGRRRRWHRWHVHHPHRHHWHHPHRWHAHVPHRWHVHIPHRHHFHAAAIVKSIGAGVATALKAVGDLICYEISFSFMDIIKGLSNLLSWMMAPINAFIDRMLAGLGISLPSFNIPWPSFNLNLPVFSFNWSIDFLSFNWPSIDWALELLAALSIDIPNLLPKCMQG